jgi:uncharacterized membrane protein YhaH (DUF805 family)
MLILERREMITRRDYFIIILSIFAPIVSGIILHFILLLPLSFILVICVLVILFPSWFDLYVRLRNLEKRITGMERRSGALVNMVKLIVDALIGVRTKLSQLHRNKALTAGDFTDIFDEAAFAISGGIIDAYFRTLGGELSNPGYEERKKMLLEKAMRREISREEGEELKGLLERQKREREAAGDILGAIMLGLLILFVIGVLAALFGRKD